MGGHHPAHCGPELSRRQRGRPCLLQDCGSWHMGLPWPCAAPHTIRSPASQAFGLRLNHTTGFPGSPTRRGQTVGRLSLHNCMRQLLVKNLCTPYWFCFSGELCLTYACNGCQGLNCLQRGSLLFLHGSRPLQPHAQLAGAGRRLRAGSQRTTS